LASILMPFGLDQECAKAKFSKDYERANPTKVTTTVGLNIGKIDTEGIR